MMWKCKIPILNTYITLYIYVFENLVYFNAFHFMSELLIYLHTVLNV